MELNRKDYRKYVSPDCTKCHFYKDSPVKCSLPESDEYYNSEWNCFSDDMTVDYIFKLIKK